MNLSGIVQNGVIVLDDGHSLPEGTHVRVSVAGSTLISSKHRVTFPLVRSEKPGSVHLTNGMIGEILDEDDAAGVAIVKPGTHAESPETAPNIPNPK